MQRLAFFLFRAKVMDFAFRLRVQILKNVLCPNCWKKYVATHFLQKTRLFRRMSLRRMRRNKTAPHPRASAPPSQLLCGGPPSAFSLCLFLSHDFLRRAHEIFAPQTFRAEPLCGPLDASVACSSEVAWLMTCKCMDRVCFWRHRKNASCVHVHIAAAVLLATHLQRNETQQPCQERKCIDRPER